MTPGSPPRSRLAIVAPILALMLLLVAPSADAATPRPGHRCGCAEHCAGASCCCPDDAMKAKPSADPAPSRPVADRGEKAAPAPCLGTLPCGDEESPSAPSGTSISKATRPTPLTFSPEPAASGWAIPRGPSAASVPPARLDDPPERLARAG